MIGSPALQWTGAKHGIVVMLQSTNQTRLLLAQSQQAQAVRAAVCQLGSALPRQQVIGWGPHKLPSAVLALEALFTVMGVSVFDT